MANLLDLRNKINSTRNTGQITRALEMVSAARQKKAADFLSNSRFLRVGLRGLITQIKNNPNFETDSADLPKFFSSKNSGKDLILTIMSQRGLCGGLNSSLFFEILKLKKTLNKQLDFITVNKSSQRYLKGFKENIVSFFGNVKENPDLDDILPVIDYIKDNYSKYDEVYIAYSNFIKSGIFEPKIIKLLPIDLTSTEKNRADTSILSYTIEPDPITVLDSLSNLYIDLEIYEAVLSSQAAEHSARMIAMKKATDNVKTVVDNLTLKMNKERQAKITQQMAEISSNL